MKQCLVPVAESSWLAPGPRPFAAVESKELRVAAIVCCDIDLDRKSTRLNSSHIQKSRMPSSA